MSKRKISSYFGSERHEETEKGKDQNDLRVGEAEGDGNTNPKGAKTSNESRNFQVKWLKEHTRLRYENQAMFCHFCRLGEKSNSNQAFIITWTSRCHHGSSITADLCNNNTKVLSPNCSRLSPSKGLEGRNCLLRMESWLKP